MSFDLTLTDKPERGIGAAKDIGDNVFLRDLPLEYKVYVFYYPGAIPDDSVEQKLMDLGEISGANALINIGRLDDPDYDRIARRFEIVKLPLLVVTAIDTLASVEGDFFTAFVKVDNRSILDSPEKTVELVERLINLFLTGDIAEAMKAVGKQERGMFLSSLGIHLTDALKGIGNFIANRDFSIGVATFKLEIKRAKD